MSINYFTIFCCVLGLISSIGFSANVLAFSLFAKHNSQLSKLDMLVLSMLLADLLTLLMMPFILASAAQNTWRLGNAFCKTFQYLLTFSLAASIYSLSTVSVARALVVLRPFHRPDTSTMILMLISVWILSFFSTFPLRMHSTIESRFVTNITYCLPTLYEEHNSIVLAQFILYYLIPMLIIGISYICLGLVLHKRPMMSVVSSRNTRRASLLIFCTAATFSACWLPLYTLELCIYLGLYHHNLSWDTFYFLCNILQYLHPCVNPMLYVFASKRYWNGRTFCCRKIQVHPKVISATDPL